MLHYHFFCAVEIYRNPPPHAPPAADGSSFDSAQQHSHKSDAKCHEPPCERKAAAYHTQQTQGCIHRMCRSTWPWSGARRHYATPNCGGRREATSPMRNGMRPPARERPPHATSDRDRYVAKEWIGTHGLRAAHACMIAHPTLEEVGTGKSSQRNRDPSMCQRG
jgi:hypothetical protein